MCATCGCSGAHSGHHHPHHHHPHEHGHDHDHQHGHEHDLADGLPSRTIALEIELLAHNDQLAAANRQRLAARDIACVNLMGAPGGGKTSLLERTIVDLHRRGQTISVIEGDQETERDANRLRQTGCAVLQVNTGAGCHLDASMVGGAIDTLRPPDHSILVIENVGNLVCPALFDLGERAKVVVMSMTEGEDKPIKYPHMFRAANLVILTKVDLAPHLDASVADYAASVRHINPRADMVAVSAKTGAGMSEWYGWIEQKLAGPRARARTA